MAAKPILSVVVVVLLVIALTAVNSHPAVTTEGDEKECAEQFRNLAACIPYVTGSAKKPTPECCADTEKVRGSDPKCLCVLILDSASANDSVRLPVAINPTLALLMPAACSSNAKVSDCPRILNLPPNSPAAKNFQDAAAAIVNPSSASNSSPGSAGSGSDSRVNGGRLEDVVARLLLLGLSISAAVFSI